MPGQSGNKPSASYLMSPNFGLTGKRVEKGGVNFYGPLVRGGLKMVRALNFFGGPFTEKENCRCPAAAGQGP